MTRPAVFDSTALTVAGDTDYTAQGDAYDGSVVKVEPAAGLITQGLMRPGKQVPAQHYNWIMNQFAQIMGALISDDDATQARLATDETELSNHEGRITTLEGWTTGYSPRIKIREFLASGTLVVPTRVRFAMAFGCGGGGSGGGGKSGVSTVDKWIAGGGGGGGSIPLMLPLGTPGVPLIPGSTINIDVGPGGAAAGIGAWGNDGSDSIVRYGTEILAVFPGAAGGFPCMGDHLFAKWVHYTPGGLSRRGVPQIFIGPNDRGIRWWDDPSYDFSLYAFDGSMTSGPYGGPQSLILQMQPAQGGYGNGSGASQITSIPGAANPVSGYAGGAGHIQGGDGLEGGGGDTTKRGGGSGGGGGGGGWGNGGDGGWGAWGESGIASNGNAGDANSGAGGGGGGSGGYSGAGGNGGQGGSGRVYIITVEEAT